MNWFEKLTGFKEESPEQVRQNIGLRGEQLVSKVNGKTYQCGTLEIPTLEYLRDLVNSLDIYEGQKNTVKQVVGNVQDFHLDPDNQGALFQAASQFNLLEMVGPHVTPEQGVAGYEHDRTQGPACAIACGAGTIFRNYFIEFSTRTGQSVHEQVDCMEDMEQVFRDAGLKTWNMQNGYLLTNRESLKGLNKWITSRNKLESEALKGKLKVGIQWDTEVTLNDVGHHVTQVYCSALPVAYSRVEPIYWQELARIVLEATYEATILAGILNKYHYGSNKVFLTLVGGGAFGNHIDWILDSVEHVLRQYHRFGLDIQFISYSAKNIDLEEMIEVL